MAGILSLPTELLFEVFSHLGSLNDSLNDGYNVPPSSSSPSPSPSLPAESTAAIQAHSQKTSQWDFRASYKTLQSLTRTCRVFHPIAKQLLYEHYRAEFEAPINDYIRRLAIEPVLPSYIRHISIPFDGTDLTGDMRPKYEIRKDLQLLGAANEHYLSVEDLAQLELAIVVLHAHNLESFRMMAQHRKPKQALHGSPAWLRPIVDAVQHGLKQSPESPRYEKLHTMDLEIPFMFTLDLGHLFSLPKLRKLRLNNMKTTSEDLARTTSWPISVANSRVQELRLVDIDVPADLIGQIVKSCKAITLFECVRDDNLFLNIDASFWCQEIVTALQLHTLSLEHLSLYTSDEGRIDRTYELHWPRVHGFQNFLALKELKTQFYVLMGIPGCVRQQVNGNRDLWVPKPDCPGLPSLRDILPPSILTLHLDMSRDMITPFVKDFDYKSLLSSAISLPAGPKLCLETFGLRFNHIAWGQPLPLNFWDVQEQYHDSGIRFNYDLDSDIMIFEDETALADHLIEISALASTLAEYGAKGIEMASHFRDLPELVDEVDALINLPDDFWDSEEGRRILFLK